MKQPVTTALEKFAEALHKAGIDPETVEVSLPLEQWRVLARTLDFERAETRSDIGQIEIAGVRYLVRFGA
jgi:hypothetical protein